MAQLNLSIDTSDSNGLEDIRTFITERYTIRHTAHLCVDRATTGQRILKSEKWREVLETVSHRTPKLFRARGVSSNATVGGWKYLLGVSSGVA